MSWHEKKTLSHFEKGEESICQLNTLNKLINQLKISYQSRYLENHIYMSHDLIHLFDPLQKEFISVERSEGFFVTEATGNSLIEFTTHYRKK